MQNPSNLPQNGQLEDMINCWLDYYTKNGDRHYSDTPDWKIREIYWDQVVSRVIEDVDTEMTDEEIERFCDRLAVLQHCAQTKFFEHEKNKKKAVRYLIKEYIGSRYYFLENFLSGGYENYVSENIYKLTHYNSFGTLKKNKAYKNIFSEALLLSQVENECKQTLEYVHKYLDETIEKINKGFI